MAIKSFFEPRVHRPDKLYGTTTIGARGQVVIPARARKDMKLEPGDQLLVLGKFGKLIALLKAEQLGELIETIMDSIAGTEYEPEVRQYIKEVFGSIHKK